MFIADLHLHSKYSRATGKECTPEFLDLWARRKGIDLIGTGDFTHPAWQQTLTELLEPAEEGFYRLKSSARLEDPLLPNRKATRFVLSGEISSIYKKNGKVRKVHNLILLPSLAAAQTLSRKLAAIGNIHSDGRPILGLDSRDLLEMTLDACPEAVLIPAHIWTPHFSLFGAFSGFDTIAECFEDLTPYIHALETGLSSDPPMNWRLSALDQYTMISNSDAHSPGKLGREANLLDTAFSYPALTRALQEGASAGFAGTLEFFPEEGKYHYDGHRGCKLRFSPAETREHHGRCPVCGGKITIGVLHRVEELADRPAGFCPRHPLPFERLLPLQEVIAAATGFSAISIKGKALYERLLREFGSELTILRQQPTTEIAQVAGPGMATGICRMRQGQINPTPGYDGEYGKIQLLTPAEIADESNQAFFFGANGLFEKVKKKTASTPKSACQAEHHPVN